MSSQKLCQIALTYLRENVDADHPGHGAAELIPDPTSGEGPFHHLHFMEIPLDIVKKYSPVFQFHENEQYLPCSIEYLLENSTLHYRNVGFAYPLPGQPCGGTPSIVTFNEWLYMVYLGPMGHQFCISRSLDGLA